MATRIHPTAMIENDVVLGDGTTVWDHAHIRHGSRLGQDCIVGGKATIAYDVQIGDRVKINSAAYICHGVTVEDGVMISAGVLFTNDRFPRATTPDLQQLRSSDPDEHTYRTLVQDGATIGAGAVIGSNLTIGRFAMVGMASVVTHDVPDFHLVLGNPARSAGVVCRCGRLLCRWTEHPPACRSQCCECGRAYDLQHGLVTETGNLPEDHQTLRKACCDV